MANNGIPPSLDRQERNRNLALAAAALVALALGFTAVIVQVPEYPQEDPAAGGQSGEERLSAYLAEKERASAYAAVRDELDTRKEEPWIAAVYCRDSRHRWIGDNIEFQGDVDFAGVDGRMYAHTYTAVLAGNSNDGWTVESVEVRRAGTGALR